MNMGTSFLVAPINHTASKIIRNNFEKVRDFLQSKNEMYIKAQNPDEDEGENEGQENNGDGKNSPRSGGGAAASGGAGGGLASRLKKSPSQIKTEYL